MWLDILSGTIVIVGILQGYRNGLIKALISFFSIIIGLVLAFQLAGWMSDQLKSYTHLAAQWLPFISFLIVMIGIMILLRMITSLLQSAANWLMIGWLDTLLGMVLYVFIYLTIMSAVVYFMHFMHLLEEVKYKESISYPILLQWWPYCFSHLKAILPHNFSLLG
jgi:membrane protein required for colicin V production